MDPQEEAHCKILIYENEHVDKFLFSNGFGCFNIDFSCNKTDFSDAGKLHMIIETTERSGAGEIKVTIPMGVEQSDSLESKFTHQSTGKLGEYVTHQRQVAHVKLSLCLKALILYCNFQHVLTVQHGTKRHYYIYGPSLQALIDRMVEELHAASNRHLSNEEFEKNYQRKIFLDKVFAAYRRFSDAEIGSMIPLLLLYDEEKYKTNFHAPIKEALQANGRTYDMLRVQGVVANPTTREVMLDLGIFFQENKIPKDKQFRLSVIKDFCTNFSLASDSSPDVVIRYQSKPNLSSTVMIGPFHYKGAETLEALQAAIIGMPCVYIAMEDAQQTNFSIKVEPVASLLLEMDKAKQERAVFTDPKDSVTIAGRLYTDIRSGANLHQQEIILSQEEMIRRRMAEYSTR